MPIAGLKIIELYVAIIVLAETYEAAIMKQLIAFSLENSVAGSVMIKKNKTNTNDPPVSLTIA